MCHHPHQGGFTLVAAIFLLVVLAALGTFLVAVSTRSQTSADQYLERGRAYQAARAGLEWEMYELATHDGRCIPPAVLSASTATLADFRIQVACEPRPGSAFQGPPSAKGMHACLLTSRATRSRPGAIDFVARELHLTVPGCAVPAGETASGASLSRMSSAGHATGYLRAHLP
ncbi:MAG: pilus assembly PilX N-terminal domain-containing protein [Betaproteobacteria bacterium]|nr:pilus assembly PilX N-terminal domain-containing protein [Betaproteobacteria bacterium]